MIRTLCTPGQDQEIVKRFLITFQLASGLSKPIFQYPKLRAPHLEGHFYKHLRNFLVSNNLSFEIAGIETATPPQEFDCCIMDIVTSDDAFKDRDIKYVFNCKSFLQVRWVSDLCNADGTSVLSNIKDGFRSIQQSQSKYEEIIQERPYDKIWTVWRQFLKKHICNNKWKLKTPLGPWKISSDSSDCLWPFLLLSREKYIVSKLPTSLVGPS